MKNIILLTAVIVLGFSFHARAEVIHFDYQPTIEFRSEKPFWYQSDFNQFLEKRALSLEIPLEPTDGTDGDWSMHLTNPNKTQPLGKAELGQKLLFVGMRYKFK